jgi:hypothetical protein
MATKRKDVPADVDRQKTPRNAFPRSTKVKRGPDDTHEFAIRSKIAHLVDRQRGSRISAVSVVLHNGGVPDKEGNVRARVNTGKGYTYFTVPERLLR